MLFLTGTSCSTEKSYLNGNGIGRAKALNSASGALATFLTLSKYLCLCFFFLISSFPTDWIDYFLNHLELIGV